MSAHYPDAAALLSPPAVADENLGSIFILPSCDAPDLTERTSQALVRARAVDFAATMPGGAATKEEVVRHRHYLAVVKAQSAAVTSCAAPSNQQLVAQMQQMQQKIQQQVQQIQQQMQQIQQQMQLQQQVGHVRQLNAWCYRPEDPIRHFPNASRQMFPQCFPATFGALDALTSNSSRTCLQYYGLQQHGTAIERRRRFAEHLCVKFLHPLQALEDRLEVIDGLQRRADARQRNYSAIHGAYVLVAFPNEYGDRSPLSFPETLQ